MSNDIICELCGILVDGNKYNLHLRLEHKKQKQEVKKIIKEHLCETCHKTFTSKLRFILFIITIFVFKAFTISNIILLIMLMPEIFSVANALGNITQLQI